MALSFAERYDQARPTYTKVNKKRFADLEAGTTVLIPSPADIEAEINHLAADERITFTELRQRLATRHHADGSCPVMTGMNLRVVAELAIEAVDTGIDQAEVAPVWNVIDPDSPLAAKLPGGRARIKTLRS